MRALFIFAIVIYQHTVSPLLGPRCRFYPSCSQYAVLSLRQQQGSLIAVFKKIFCRLLRCHPGNDGGLDLP